MDEGEEASEDIVGTGMEWRGGMERVREWRLCSVRGWEMDIGRSCVRSNRGETLSSAIFWIPLSLSLKTARTPLCVTLGHPVRWKNSKFLRYGAMRINTSSVITGDILQITFKLLNDSCTIFTHSSSTCTTSIVGMIIVILSNHLNRNNSLGS